MAYDKKMKVLVVDDFSTMRKIVKNILKQIGLTNVVEAEDGGQAFDIVKKGGVDLIVSDWNMPRVTGIEFLRMVRADKNHADIPFLMVTAEAQRENLIEAIQAKVTNYVVKPFTPATLESKIEAIFR